LNQFKRVRRTSPDPLALLCGDESFSPNGTADKQPREQVMDEPSDDQRGKPDHYRRRGCDGGAGGVDDVKAGLEIVGYNDLDVRDHSSGR